MSMTRKLWSLSALAVEFEIDRRAVARRIDGTSPAGEIKGKSAWRLADVAPALAHGTGKAAKEPITVPPGFEQLAFTVQFSNKISAVLTSPLHTACVSRSLNESTNRAILVT